MILNPINSGPIIQILIAVTACLCFTLIVLTVIGIAIWAPTRFKTVAGGARIGFLGLAATCAGVMIKAITAAAKGMPK